MKSIPKLEKKSTAGRSHDRSKKYPEGVERKARAGGEATLTSRELADWSFDRYWEYMEGLEKDNESQLATFLREILYNVAMEWECLVANIHSTAVEFPEELIEDWFSQVTLFLETAEATGEFLTVRSSQRN